MKKCPMTFNDPSSDRYEGCRGRECMWFIEVSVDGRYRGACAVWAKAFEQTHIRKKDGGRP